MQHALPLPSLDVHIVTLSTLVCYITPHNTPSPPQLVTHLDNLCICILNVLRVTIHNQNLHKITEICKFCSLRHSIIDDIQSQFSITTLKSSITILKRLRFSITILKRLPALSKLLVTKFVAFLNNVQTTKKNPPSVLTFPPLKHHKNCECCPVSQLIVR